MTSTVTDGENLSNFQTWLQTRVSWGPLKAPNAQLNQNHNHLESCVGVIGKTSDYVHVG